jgi:hypothetical protein
VASTAGVPWFFCAALVGPIASLKLLPGAMSDAEANVGTTSAGTMKVRAIATIRREGQRNCMFMRTIPQERITSAHANILPTQLKDAASVKLK